MTNKTPTRHDTKKQAKVVHPGMMGDGTEEQNLGKRGNPTALIKKGAHKEERSGRRLQQTTPRKIA